MPYSNTSMNGRIPNVLLAGSEEGLQLTLDDVVTVFACSENFVPYLSVALESLVENTSPDRRYDIVVLTRDISPSSMLTLSHQCNRDNIGIGFLDVEAAIGNRKLPHYGHFRLETYFRLLAPSLLPSVKKAVYLDSDLVVLDDIAKLWDTDVEGKLLAATRDADTIGQIDGYDQGVGPYLAHDLGLTDPHGYFQAGVLVMNLEEFRRRTTPEELLGLATQRVWRWLDQDVLNRVADERFPNSVKEVVFDRRGGVAQFSPTADGRISLTPDEDAELAAKLAFEGYDPVGESLYFINPSACNASWFNSRLTYTATIGDHVFYA